MEDGSAHESESEVSKTSSRKVVDAKIFVKLQGKFKYVFNECLKVKKSNFTLNSQLKELEASHMLNEENKKLIEELKSREEKLTSKMKEVELERDNLLRESQRIKSDFSKCMLVRKNLETLVLNLENDLKETKSVKLNLGECSNKLDRMLGNIHVKNDKQRIGYDYLSTTPSTFNKVNLKKASDSIQVLMAKNLPPPIKKANKFSREVYVCSYCKRRDHLRDFCYKLLRTQDFLREVKRVPQSVDSLNDLKKN